MRGSSPSGAAFFSYEPRMLAFFCARACESGGGRAKPPFDAPEKSLALSLIFFLPPPSHISTPDERCFFFSLLQHAISRLGGIDALSLHLDKIIRKLAVTVVAYC